MRVIYRLAALAVIAILAGGGYALYRLNQPYRGFSEPVFLEFPRGASTRPRVANRWQTGFRSSNG